MHELDKQRYWIREGLYVTLLFLLLREWMLPIADLSEITQVYKIEPFLFAIFLFLLLQYIRCSLALSLVINVFISLALIAYYFHYGSIFDLFWWKQLITTFGNDLYFISDLQWHRLSGELRTFLFLIGWSLLVYAIYALLAERHTISWFVSGTFLYLLFLQYVWGLDTSYAIGRTVAVGTLLIVVSRGAKRNEHSDGVLLQGESHLNARRIRRLTWGGHARRNIGGWKALIIGGFVFAVASGMAAWIAVAEPPPKPLITTLATQQMNQTGYGMDDSQLGHSLQPNHQVAFTAFTEQLTYWKGETKSFYDGAGWHERNENELNVTDMLQLPTQEMQTDWVPVQQEVYIQQRDLGESLFRGGSRITIHDIRKGEHGEQIGLDHVYYDEAADRYRLSPGQRTSSYKITTYLPKQSLRTDTDTQVEWSIDSATQRLPGWQSGGMLTTNVLQADDDDGKYGDNDGQTSTDVGHQYLQLPATLPERVRGLAEQIAGDLTDPYEIAQAIEHRLSRDYTYTLEETERPVGRQDFVDHFLFDQQQGYCDHFSTSMVVMLRALGIPARWAKGFTPGEITTGSGTDSDDIYEVVVRNSNAHSWVEAYIPEQGWVTFEPTPGFSADGLSSVDDEAALPTFSASDEFGQVDAHAGTWWGGWSRMFQTPRIWFIGFLTLASLFLLAFIWDILRRIRLLLAVVRLRFCTTSEQAKPALALLWKRWFELYGPKASDKTLREYIAQVQPRSAEQEVAMRAFLEATEQIQYGHNVSVKPLRKRIGMYWRKGCD